MKKLIVLAASAAAFATTAIAGGLSDYATPAAAGGPATNLYIQGQFGYAQTNWKNQLGPAVVGQMKHGNGSYTYGADMGYQFSKNLAMEMGAFYLPQARSLTNTARAAKTWLAYGGLKFSVPVAQNVDLYAKAALGYNHNRGQIDPGSVGSSVHHWGFAGGLGVDYVFPNNMLVDVQYMRFAGKTKNNVLETTSPNLWTVGLGYKFNM